MQKNSQPAPKQVKAILGITLGVIALILLPILLRFLPQINKSFVVDPNFVLVTITILSGVVTFALTWYVLSRDYDMVASRQAMLTGLTSALVMLTACGLQHYVNSPGITFLGTLAVMTDALFIWCDKKAISEEVYMSGILLLVISTVSAAIAVIALLIYWSQGVVI